MPVNLIGTVLFDTQGIDPIHGLQLVVIEKMGIAMNQLQGFMPQDLGSSTLVRQALAVHTAMSA